MLKKVRKYTSGKTFFAAQRLKFFGVCSFNTVLVVVVSFLLVGCVSDDVKRNGLLSEYQQNLVEKGPQSRVGDWGIDSLKPVSDPSMPLLDVVKDDSGEKARVHLSLDQALIRAMANSPEITIVSFEPSIAKEDVTAATSAFDLTAFGRVNYDKTDSPQNSQWLGGQSNTRLFESGLKQKVTTGAEWSLSYAMTRNWDDLITRTLPKRYEPILTFQIKQPLLRDAWQEVNLAGVNISKLNYRIALADFRQKAEEVSTQIVFAYWTLMQARSDYEIQTDLVNKTIETLQKVRNRSNIDATIVQIKQAESSLRTRQGEQQELRKRVFDVQDQLVRLLADQQINVLSDYEVIPTTEPLLTLKDLNLLHLLNVATINNPAVEQAKIALEVAQINVDVATRQLMPRLDLVASVRSQGLSEYQGESIDQFGDTNYVSYAVGLTFEYPLGNRRAKAEQRKRTYEHSRAIASLNNVNDQIATLVKERERFANVSYREIEIQQQAIDAAAIHLQALKDTEVIRDKMTPEFLLVKLQAQESLAVAQRRHTKSIADYNIALIRLAQAMGTVLELDYVERSLPVAFAVDDRKTIDQPSSDTIDQLESETVYQSDAEAVAEFLKGFD